MDETTTAVEDKIMCGSRGGGGGGGGGGQGVQIPPEQSKNVGFSSKRGPNPLKNRSYQARIQCWDIISMPAKCHCWRADDGSLLRYLDPPSPHQLKKKQK